MNKVGKKVLSFGLAVSLLAGSIFPAVTTRAAEKRKYIFRSNRIIFIVSIGFKIRYAI